MGSMNKLRDMIGVLKKEGRMKKLAYILIILLVLTSCTRDKTVEKVNGDVVQIEASYQFDINDFEMLVGYADFVFVGKVNKELGTLMKHGSEEVETCEPINDPGTPYTNYEVIVEENIKGELITDKPIEIQKAGGYDGEGRLVLFNNDLLPEEGKEYIFVVYVQQNGDLLASGENTTFLLNDDILAKIKEGYRNQKVGDRQRFTTQYSK